MNAPVTQTHNAPHKADGEYFAALDGFRGLLAVFVAVYHTIWLSHPNQWEFFNNGPVIIDLFFAFSGFLMYRLYADTLSEPGQVAGFMKRRFARLYPLHLFMLLVFLAFAVARLMAHQVGLADQTPGEILPFQPGAVESWAALLQNLTLTNALGLSDSLSFNPPSWTIGAEFCTYIVFAAMMLWAAPKRWGHFALIGLGVVAIYAALSRAKPNMNITHDLGFWRCMAGFFTGLIAARVQAALKPHLAKLSRATFTILELIVLGGSVAFVIYAGGQAQFFIGPVIFAFVVLFAFDGGAVSRFMSARVFRYLAKISYSVYMTHVIVAIVFAIAMERLTGALQDGYIGDIWLVAYLIAVIIVSHFTQRFIEVPGGRFIRRMRAPQKRVAKSPTTG